jgi:hypothetical protein
VTFFAGIWSCDVGRLLYALRVDVVLCLQKVCMPLT